jgi:hypothetical protein
MKRPCLALLSLVLFANAAQAFGLNLAWDQCYGDAPPVVRKLFACDRNTGVDMVVASFVPAFSHSTGGLLEIQFDIQTRSGVTLPVWWDFATLSSCRRNQATIGSVPLTPLLTCRDLGSNPVVAIRDDYRYPTPDHMVLTASAQAGNTPLVGGVEYFAYAFVISHALSTGAGACAGCLEPVAITLTALRAGFPSPEILTVPAGGNVVGWQQDLPVAVRNVTWSAVKSLYH